MIVRMECGSARNGRLAEGCDHCLKGSKMVLFITGRCRTGCYYCPVSNEKKGRNVVYANERKVHCWDDIFEEADSMDATGTGITGGDPFEDMDRTLRAIRTLKEHYGPSHHIHLYTSTMDPEKVRMAQEAGLDEIRFHPSEKVWSHMEDTCLAQIVSEAGLDVGLEVPVLPDYAEELNDLLDYASRIGVKFVNLNELEFSEGNWDMMEEHGYQLEDDLSSAIKGSRQVALDVMRNHRRLNTHLCSSSFKDGVQLRNRLLRKAEISAAPYEEITEDGTVVKGVVYGDADTVMAQLRTLGVPEDMMAYNEDRNRIEVSRPHLEKVSGRLGCKCYIIEEYPTADRLEVERMPL